MEIDETRSDDKTGRVQDLDAQWSFLTALKHAQHTSVFD
jgi:hypothetical protein